MKISIHGIARPKMTALVPLLYLLGGGSLLGLSTNLAKLAGEVGLSPLAYLCWSVLGAAVVLTAVALLRGIVLPLDRRTLEYYAVAALVGVAGPNLIFFSVIPHVGAGFVALIIALPPLLTYVGALVFRLERYQTVRAVGVMAALAGAGTLAVGKLTTASDEVLWVILALAGPILLTIGNLYRTLRWPQGVSADALAPGMLAAAAVMLLGAGLLPGFSLAVPTAQGSALLLIALQVLVFSGQFLLLFMLQKTGGPVLLSLLGSVGAVVGVPIAILVQSEAPPSGLFIGATLIAAGTALVSQGRLRSKTPSHKPFAQGET